MILQSTWSSTVYTLYGYSTLYLYKVITFGVTACELIILVCTVSKLTCMYNTSTRRVNVESLESCSKSQPNTSVCTVVWNEVAHLEHDACKLEDVDHDDVGAELLEEVPPVVRLALRVEYAFHEEEHQQQHHLPVAQQYAYKQSSHNITMCTL